MASFLFVYLFVLAITEHSIARPKQIECTLDTHLPENCCIWYHLTQVTYSLFNIIVVNSV